MPTIDQIRTAIAAKISAVPDAGKVHSFERFAKSEKDFRAMYEFNGQVRGWNVRRIGRVEKSPAVSLNSVVNKWRISGFMSLSDAEQSELVFDRLIEAMTDAFIADESLGGVVLSTTPEGQETAGLQLEDSGPVMFAGVLCHSARLILYTWHMR